MFLTVNNNFPDGLRRALTTDIVETIVGINGADYYVNSFDASSDKFSLHPTDEDGVPLPGAAQVVLDFTEIESIEIY